MKESKFNFDIVQLSKQNNIETCIQSGQIYNFLRLLKKEYPAFDEWYKQLYCNEGYLKANREILICKVDNTIAGISILKSDIYEKKICTFRVKEEFQCNGIGRKLMEKSFEYLNTDKPLITIHKSKEKQFERLFKYYNFKLEQKNRNYYRFFNTELAFNGELPKKEILLNKLEIVNLEKVILKMLHNSVDEKIEDVICNYLNDYNLNNQYC